MSVSTFQWFLGDQDGGRTDVSLSLRLDREITIYWKVVIFPELLILLLYRRRGRSEGGKCVEAKGTIIRGERGKKGTHLYASRTRGEEGELQSREISGHHVHLAQAGRVE